MHANYTITWPDGHTSTALGIETSYGDEVLYQLFDELRAHPGITDRDITAVSDALHATYRAPGGDDLDLKPNTPWRATHNGVEIHIEATAT